jgi:hypothetical protein
MLPSVIGSVAEVYREGGDYADARRWWEKAAAAGETTAMINLSYFVGVALGSK